MKVKPDMQKIIEEAIEAAKCENSGHFDSLYYYSGADIYWRCDKCGRVKKQEGGNLPMTI